MTGHDRYQEQILLLVEGDLGPSERAELELHLASCESCRAELQAARELERVTASLPVPALTGDFMDRLRGRLDTLDAGLESIEPVPGEMDPVPGFQDPPVNGRASRVVVDLTPRRASRDIRWSRPLLAAAACLLVLLATLRVLLPPESPDNPSLVTLASGAVRLQAPGAAHMTAVQDSVAVQQGTLLETGTGQETAVLVVGGSGNEVRLGGDTQVRVTRMERRPDRIEGELALNRGRVYIVESNARVAVRTPQALILPVGTRYSAELVPEGTLVKVWEGEVQVVPQGGGQTQHIRAEQQVLVRPQGTSNPQPASSDDWHRLNSQRPMSGQAYPTASP
ncbi:MAG: FecR domain-containing protein, partial [Candidatus Eremiobacterota bacterium]